MIKSSYQLNPASVSFRTVGHTTRKSKCKGAKDYFDKYFTMVTLSLAGSQEGHKREHKREDTREKKWICFFPAVLSKSKDTRNFQNNLLSYNLL